MPEGVIIKSLSGFYYIAEDLGSNITECRARGRFRLDGVTPLVGDRVTFTETESGKGIVEAVHERKSAFVRPGVANTELLVVIASAVVPVTDPYLIDRVAAIAEHSGCGVAIVINKADLDEGDSLYEIYAPTGYPVIRTSALTGMGIQELRETISGKICAFTGNSGVGKSSILNALDSRLSIKVGKVSDKLGRGRHTTRHVELFPIGNETYIADTPGFASFDMDKMEFIPPEELQYCFPEFEPYLGNCRFRDCAHLKEPGCAVTEAVGKGGIHASRHAGYANLHHLASQINEWELN